MMLSILEISDLSHGFGDRTLFRNVQVQLSPREHVALIGRNGVGKSTFLQIIADFISHDAGYVKFQNNIQYGYLTQHADLSQFATIGDALRHAFAPIFAKEELLQTIAEKLGTVADQELERLLERYANLQEELERDGIYELGSRVDSVASGLGLLELGLDRPVANLSGGQRTKVLLGQLLLQQPDVLLLDEPTNFLDAEHVIWLKDYLQNYPQAFIVISHEADFLEEVGNVIWSIENAQLIRYNGKYSAYLAYAQERNAQQVQAFTRQQQEIKRTEEFIDKNIARASTTKRAQSRRKALEKLDRIEIPPTTPPPSFPFVEAPSSAKISIDAKGLQIGYSHALLPPLDIIIEQGSKIALVGYNGIGKSTLLRTLVGELPAFDGKLQRDEKLQIGYFAQENYQHDQMTALERVWQHVPSWPQQDVRKALARSGLKQEHITQQIRSLSGGEQAKIRLCILTLHQYNALVLDEPTNHLDNASRNALQAALKKFRGTVILVSHEPIFYQSIVDSTVDLESLFTRGVADRIIAHGAKSRR
ncbi:putative ABC transporter ATP-binding protein YheS [Acidibacillus sp. S0AB]|uniref:ABC transporter ATP-binding protein YheS n=1 Tax=Sulfoacidibacillus ferrooxidans TaxID=2005001 RepID=A0A9X2AED1_9BACL|nr:putative ABC transporter ATP-binding protein YheS [Sulfoacidibacillus ferrooxidans]